MVNQIAEMVHENDDMDATGLGQAELLRVDAGIAYCLPGRNRIRPAGGVDRLLELLKMHEAQSELPEIVHMLVKNPSSFIETLQRRNDNYDVDDN
jgi:hypothetical protein